MQTSVLISAAVHVALGVYLYARGSDEERRRVRGGRPDGAPIEMEMNVEPVEVRLLDETEAEAETETETETEAEAEAETETETEMAWSGIGHPASGIRIGGEKSPPPGTRSEPAAEGEPDPGTMAMAMRAGRDVETRIEPRDGGDRGGVPAPGDVAGRVVVDPGAPEPRSPLAPPERRRPRTPRSELRPSGGGTHEHRESVFTAHVDRDGTVDFEDADNFHVELALPGPGDVARGLESWYEARKNHPMGREDDEPGGPTVQEDEDWHDTGMVPILGGGFDLTDWAERAAGNDPYAARKLAFLDRTRDERAAIAAEHQREDLRDSLAHLPGLLTTIWTHRQWTRQRRRRALFQLWDECAEDGADDVIRAARQARATIEAFIRRELPAGSRHAYPAAELERLNRERDSEQRFAPYQKQQESR